MGKVRPLVPFDAGLERRLGLSASEALLIAAWVVHRVADEMDRHAETIRRLISTDERARRENRSWELSEGEFRGDGELTSLMSDHDRPRSPLGFRYGDLEGQFGEEKAQAFPGLFASKRGGDIEYSSIDDENPAPRRPLLEYREGEAACPVSTALIKAVWSRLSEELPGGRLGKRFFKRRGRAIEEASEKTFRAYCGDEAEYYPPAYETPDLQYEHDLVVNWRRTLLIVEAKSSPVRGPRRVPGRALTRLRDDFRGASRPPTTRASGSRRPSGRGGRSTSTARAAPWRAPSARGFRRRFLRLRHRPRLRGARDRPETPPREGAGSP